MDTAHQSKMAQLRKTRSATFTVDGTCYRIVASSSGEEAAAPLLPDVEPCNEDSGVVSCITEPTESPLKGILFNSLASSDYTRYAENKIGVDGMPKPGSPEASFACAKRLRNLARLVEGGRIGRDDLVRNINYAVNVLEAVYVDETNKAADRLPISNLPKPDESQSKKASTSHVTPQKLKSVNGVIVANQRRLCNEDDDLSEVNPGSVPNEVRDWLASTFTRASTSMKPNREKPKFRSVANAIRAGIMVDKIYRRTSNTASVNIPPNILQFLKGHIDEWSFNIFELNFISDEHALKYMGLELFQRYDLISKLKLNVTMLENFLSQVEIGYSKFKNPYHNLIHGADVAQTCHQVMSQSKLVNWLTDLEIFSTIFAALIHDYEHSGTTNTFHINTSSDLALLYNDRGVLENHHISAVFKLLKKDDMNIVASFSKDDYREFRMLVIEMVLNTDMSLHFQQIKTMKNLLSMPENIDKTKALSLMMHCADISHPAKSWHVHHEWTMLLMEEFFRQGDREAALNLPFSPLCDRKTTLVAQSQIGFIDFIVQPSLEILGDMLEKIMTPLFDQQHKQTDKEAVRSRSDTASNLKSGDSIDSDISSLKYVYVRPWVPCIIENKKLWKEKAETEVPNSLPVTNSNTNGDDNVSPSESGEKEETNPSSDSNTPHTTPIPNATPLEPIEETG